LVRHRHYRDEVASGLEVDRVREMLEQAPSEIAIHNRELLVALAHPFKDMIDFEQERRCRVVISFLVPVERRVDIAARNATDLYAHR
jgi:hypothetical protein